MLLSINIFTNSDYAKHGSILSYFQKKLLLFMSMITSMHNSSIYHIIFISFLSLIFFKLNLKIIH